ncbi:Vgb family protein [Gemmatimonas sp.]|uniref:Vgb family protein n=1 Tax=Gemmatimonas sp. TaxID=1962908 RepID=UPI003DA697B1
MMSTPSIVRVAMTSLCLPALSFATSLHAQASSTGRKTAADTVALTEWDVPWGAATRPRDPSIDPQGRVWFVGQEGNYVARFDPASKKFERFEIDPGTNPHTVNVDPTGDAWYAGNRNGMIGRIDGKTGKITRYPMPDAAAKDPHTITFTPKGDLWFTLQNSNMVGFLEKQTGAGESHCDAHAALSSVRHRPRQERAAVVQSLRLPTSSAPSIPRRCACVSTALPDERARGRRIALT